MKDSELGHKRGHGGCAILWSQTLATCVRPLPNLGGDRVCVIQIIINDVNYYVISAYMPHQTCRISDYEEEINILQRVCNECSEKGYIYKYNIRPHNNCY